MKEMYLVTYTTTDKKKAKLVANLALTVEETADVNVHTASQENMDKWIKGEIADPIGIVANLKVGRKVVQRF